MKVSIGIGGPASGRTRDFEQQVTFVVEAEKLGVSDVWSAEAWGQDAIVPLAFLAARTTRIRLGTGIAQISARVPSMTAMTAMTMAALSNDRFILGLGVSGPQVVEGLQGRPFKAPLTRMKETVDIVRMAFRGEKIQYDGKYHVLPRPGGEGKALRLAQPPVESIPIYLATLGPKALEYTGEVADGWLGTSFTPNQARAHLDFISQGAARAGRSLDEIDIQAGGSVIFTDEPQQVIEQMKSGLAFTLGAMGSATTNFYNDAYKRAGWADAASEVQRLWVEGKRDEATRLVPDDMVEQSNLIGDETRILERLKVYRDAGVTTLRVAPGGNSMESQLETLGRTMDLIRSLDDT
ncbi:MAG: LLM class F420-dependent oxidoreductase [Gammaproteobacteria bacterium]|nr:LLM class F420-dependent oxidoreductase [Gammaproteobacteria bacterium]